MEARHQGHNIKRFREMRGLKQHAFAAKLGKGWSQKKVSLMEARACVSRPVLQQVAHVLGVPVTVLECFDENQVFRNLKTVSVAGGQACPDPGIALLVEKWQQAIEENRRLYERLLAAEREKLRLQAVLAAPFSGTQGG